MTLCLQSTCIITSNRYSYMNIDSIINSDCPCFMLIESTYWLLVKMVAQHHRAVNFWSPRCLLYYVRSFLCWYRYIMGNNLINKSWLSSVKFCIIHLLLVSSDNIRWLLWLVIVKAFRFWLFGSKAGVA